MWHAFNDLSVGRKLLSGFALVVILALGVAGAGFYSIFALFERGDLMTGVAESQIHLLRARVAQQDYLHGGPADSAQRAEQSLWAMQSRLSALLEAHPGFDQYPVLLEMKQAANQYQALFTQVATQHSHATDDPARLLALQDQAQKVIAIADKAYVAPGKDMAGFNLRIVSLIGTASLLLLMVASLASWLLHRQIVQPLRHAVIALGSIAQGDLRCQLDTHRRDELGQLLLSMQSMAQGLRHLVHGIGTGVDELSCVANGFAEVSRDTGAIARRQSHEAEQSVVALQQMAVSVQAVAGHTRQASEAAQDAEQQAHSGAVLVGEVVAQIDCLAVDVQSTRASMLALARESERVGNILDVIRSVAEQTNLLALNAAIEAARAGEKGRGFAVVADEVRALARRSQDATAEIATTIDALQLLTRQALAHSENCLGQADTAVTQTRLANQSLQAITASVSLIKRMNNRIANAASEQGTCAGLVSRSVVTVRDEAQASVRKALDSDAYSCDLKRLSQALSQRVRRFHC